MRIYIKKYNPNWRAACEAHFILCLKCNPSRNFTLIARGFHNEVYQFTVCIVLSLCRFSQPQRFPRYTVCTLEGQSVLVGHWNSTRHITWYIGSHTEVRARRSWRMFDCHNQGVVDEWEPSANMGSSSRSLEVSWVWTPSPWTQSTTLNGLTKRYIHNVLLHIILQRVFLGGGRELWLLKSRD